MTILEAQTPLKFYSESSRNNLEPCPQAHAGAHAPSQACALACFAFARFILQTVISIFPSPFPFTVDIKHRVKVSITHLNSSVFLSCLVFSLVSCPSSASSSPSCSSSTSSASSASSFFYFSSLLFFSSSFLIASQFSLKHSHLLPFSFTYHHASLSPIR